ncbi:MAG TPA: DUF2117 domain-containing protein [Methanothrix sp.]|mgnify:CR=1 FL=1|nr:DUF2117 domain-containing protein [Methanothrix sp.]
MLRIGLVVHGPEIIDSGCALSKINYLKSLGSVSAVLGGTMGRVAIIDAGLENTITISPRRRPSESVRDLHGNSDAIFLINQAKSRESGLVFGKMVADAAGIDKPLIAIDCGGRFVAPLAGDASELAARVAADLGLQLLLPAKMPGISTEGKKEKKAGKMTGKEMEEKTEETTGKMSTRRSVSAVIPGELVSVNGVVIGKATESKVEIDAEGGRIVSLKGIKPKEHGLEKLSSVKIDLEKAIIRSGSIRRSEGLKARIGEMANRGVGDRQEQWATIIDHCAEDAFEAAQGASVAVTVGDDTTIIAGDILARLGIPVIGIVDGDPDRLAGCTSMLPGSIILQVMPGNDDLLGRRIKSEIFQGKSRIRTSADDLMQRIRTLTLSSGKLAKIEQVGQGQINRTFF